MTKAQRYWQPLFDSYKLNKADYKVCLLHSPTNGVFEVLIAEHAYGVEHEYWELPLTVLTDKELDAIWHRTAADYGTMQAGVFAEFGHCLIALGHETRTCFGYTADKHALDPYLAHFAKAFEAKKIRQIKKILVEGTPDD